jgi:outer membrane biogenesis lipoprotein LolB
MKTRFALLGEAVALLSGCTGGYWNRNANVCESPLFRR